MFKHSFLGFGDSYKITTSSLLSLSSANRNSPTTTSRPNSAGENVAGTSSSKLPQKTKIDGDNPRPLKRVHWSAGSSSTPASPAAGTSFEENENQLNQSGEEGAAHFNIRRFR